jgi:excisionase family DNA binding protein
MSQAWLKPTEVAEILRRSRFTVYREVKRKKLRASRINGQLLIARSELDRYERVYLKPKA